jgi:hypothetical protein
MGGPCGKVAGCQSTWPKRGRMWPTRPSFALVARRAQGAATVSPRRAEPGSVSPHGDR